MIEKIQQAVHILKTGEVIAFSIKSIPLTPSDNKGYSPLKDFSLLIAFATPRLRQILSEL